MFLRSLSCIIEMVLEHSAQLLVPVNFPPPKYTAEKVLCGVVLFGLAKALSHWSNYNSILLQFRKIFVLVQY